ncbi:glycosyltransferase 61 family protein [Curtobacterium sp. PhB136]|uniref:glycosyltransferase family 61 protein n=1 Tax=Curtobacterium sp. PhB136 TaxID=2485181 RepID=UPI00104C18E7|nr:glycosyltransferase 61 family protein [Curtobacterium sp. PhB136]TCK62994.1 uncharacterized protein DUF563 [Curtobacterium sp. PhB136]
MVAVGAGKARGWRRRQSNSDSFFRDHVQALRDLQRPVIVIAGQRTVESLAEWRTAFQFRLHVITTGESMLDLEGVNSVEASTNDAMTEYIASVGPVAAVIDEQAETLADRLQRWQRFFFHIAEGGSFISPVVPVETVWDAAVQSLTSRRIGAAEIAELQASVGVTKDANGYSVTEKNRDHLVKVKDEDAMRILPTRLGANNVRLLGSRPAGTAKSTLSVMSHGTMSDHRIPSKDMRYPELTLREFRGATQIKDAMLAINGATVLPSSFKHPWRAWNDRLRNFNDLVAALIPGDEESAHLEGSFYDLTSAVPGDAGHFITESLAKLWGWKEAKERDPSLRALYRTPSAGWDPSFERTVLEAYGIAPEDIQWEHRNVTVDRFVSASQAWQNGGRHYVHPVNRDVWKHLRGALVTPDGKNRRKVFVTRQSTPETPGPRNREDVERYFADNGFEIVDVDTMAADERAHVVGNAAVVAGFAGAGMYDMIFAEHLEKVIVLSHEANTGRNEHLIASLLADEIHYFWSRPDVEHPAGKFSSEAFNSAWDFDFDANRTDLDQLLA